MKRTIFCLVMIILACPLGTAQAASTSLNCTYRNNDGPPFQLDVNPSGIVETAQGGRALTFFNGLNADRAAITYFSVTDDVIAYGSNSLVFSPKITDPVNVEIIVSLKGGIFVKSILHVEGFNFEAKYGNCKLVEK